MLDYNSVRSQNLTMRNEVDAGTYIIQVAQYYPNTRWIFETNYLLNVSSDNEPVEHTSESSSVPAVTTNDPVEESSGKGGGRMVAGAVAIVVVVLSVVCIVGIVVFLLRRRGSKKVEFVQLEKMESI